MVRGLLVVPLVAAVVFGAGVASAQPGDGRSSGRSFPDKEVTRSLPDGWQVRLVKSGEKLDVVAPLNASRLTTEAFVSLAGRLEIGGAGSVAVDAATVATGLQVACERRVTGVQAGISAGPQAQLSVSWPPAVVLGGQVTPNMSVSMTDGDIVDVPLASKQLRGRAAGVSSSGVHVKVTSCAGVVSVRGYVRGAVATTENDSTFHVYGKPHKLSA